MAEIDLFDERVSKRHLRELAGRAATAEPDELERLLRHPGIVRWRIVRKIGERREPRMVPLLRSLLDDESGWVVAEAIMALTRSDPANAREVIEPHLARDSVIAVAAARSLRVCATGQSAGRLLALVDHENEGVREQVAHALGATGSPSAIPALARLARDPRYFVRNAAREALVAHPDQRSTEVLRRVPLHVGRLRRRRSLRESERIVERLAGSVVIDVVDVDDTARLATLAMRLLPFVVAYGLLFDDLSVGLAAFAGAGLAVNRIVVPTEPGAWSDAALVHDRARAVGTPPPAPVHRVGSLELGARRLRGVHRVGRLPAMMVALLAIELAASGPGLLAPAFAGMLVGYATHVRAEALRVARTSARTSTEVDRRGRLGPRVYLWTQEAVDPIFVFAGEHVELWPKFATFWGGVEWQDIETGEYDDVFDAVGGRLRWRVERHERPRSLVRRFLRASPRISYAEHYDYEPPTEESRSALAVRLADALAAPADTPLEALVKRFVDERER